MTEKVEKRNSAVEKIGVLLEFMTITPINSNYAWVCAIRQVVTMYEYHRVLTKTEANKLRSLLEKYETWKICLAELKRDFLKILKGGKK